MSTPHRFLIAGGGTGGHVTPALALAEAFAARDDETLVLGSERGIEGQLVPEAGFELVTLPSQQFVGKSLAHRLRAALGLVRTTLAAGAVIGRFRPELVVSVGGYAAAPAVLASALRRIPIVVVNPDAIPGRLNRFAARLAQRVFAGVEGAVDAFPVPADRIRSYGVPLRRSLIERFARHPERRRPCPPFRLLVFGGSLGARQLNRGMADALPYLSDLDLEVVHQSGEADRDWVADAYAAARVPAEVVAFDRDMGARYQWADLAFCRAGAITIAELALVGLPALLVPLPSTDDHQSANAQALEAAGAACRLDPHATTGQVIADALRSLAGDPERLAAMGRAARTGARPLAATHIADDCRALAAEAHAARDKTSRRTP